MDYKDKIANELMRAYTEKQLEAVKDRLDKNPWAVMADFAAYCHEQLTLHNVVGQSEQLVCDCGHPHHQTDKKGREYCRNCDKDWNEAN